VFGGRFLKSYIEMPCARRRPPSNRNADRRYGGSRSLVGSSPFASRANPIRRTREKAAMSATSTPLTGDPLLLAVTDAMVALHKRYHHRAPVTAKTLLLGGDLLAS